MAFRCGLVLLAILYPVLGIACSSDDIIEKANVLATKHQTFKAIRFIEDHLNICYHPRMRLELGELYQKVGNQPKAIEQWQISLNDDDLPDAVAQNVKLRVIKAMRAPNTTSKGQLLIQAGVDHAQLEGTTTDISATAVGQVRASAQEVFGYAAQPGLYGQFSALNRQYLADNRSANLLILEAGGFYQAPVFRTSAGLQLLRTERSIPFAVGQLSLGPKTLRLISEIDIRLDKPEWRLTEAVRVQIERTRFTGRLSWATNKPLDEASAQLEHISYFHPVLKSTYRFEEDELEIDARIKFNFNSNLWLMANAGLVHSNNVDWHTGLSLTWRAM